MAVIGLAVLVALPTLTHHAERVFSPAIVYLAIGAGLAGLLALFDASWLSLETESEAVEHLTEFAVIVALFAAGLKIDRRLSLRGWASPALLLVVVMPLSIVAVAAVGVWGAQRWAGVPVRLPGAGARPGSHRG